MSLFPIKWLFNAMTNAMINAIFIGGVNHGVICINLTSINIVLQFLGAGRPAAADFGAVVRARKPNSLTLWGGERELFRSSGRLPPISGAVVRARKPNSLALWGGERKLFRSPGRPPLISRAVVRARKPNSLALRGGERELFRSPGRPPLISEALAFIYSPLTF